MLHRLIQLLKAFIDLSTIVRGNLFVNHDQLVQVADTAVLLITSLEDTMALWALLLAFGAFIF